MNTIVEEYLTGLKNIYLENIGQDYWAHFENVIQGAKKENIDKLKLAYPDISNALIDLLEFADGTYWRNDVGEERPFMILGSDIQELPYYLLSSKEIIEKQNQAKESFSDAIERKYEGVDVDDKIANRADSINWLHFSNCPEIGGYSKLFIDFNPSDKGKKGQVVRYVHDPDEFKVIAESFEDYLKMLMEDDYDFINF